MIADSVPSAVIQLGFRSFGVSSMKRRHLIGSTAFGLASTVALTACAPNSGHSPTIPSSPEAVTDSSLPEVKWRLASSYPQSLDTIYGGAIAFCDRVAAMTGGRFTITPYPDGALVPGLQVLDTVESGGVECGQSASYYYIGKNPALAFGTAIPFGLTAQQQNAWLYRGGGLEAMNKLYADFNVIAFPAGNTGAQMGGWFKREVNTLRDLQGLKMRIPGIGGEVMNQLGVSVQVLPGGEIYIALERGTIDAAEFVGPHDDEKLGLNRIAPYYYYPGWWEPGATLEIEVNLNAWRKLPQEYKAVIAAAATEANTNMLASYEALNGAALQRLLDTGIELRSYSREILVAAREATADLLADRARGNAEFREVYEGWQAFREQVYAWNRVNELSFTEFSFGRGT